MADYYNMTGLVNATNVIEVFDFANFTVDGVIYQMFIVSIFFIMLLALKRFEFSRAMVSSAFVCFILSSIMVYASLLPIVFPLGFLTITALTTLYIYTVERH